MGELPVISEGWAAGPVDIGTAVTQIYRAAYRLRRHLVAGLGMSRHQVSGVALGCVLSGAALIAPGAARAEKPNCSDTVFTGQLENDFFARATNSDRHYTNGLRLAFDMPLSDDCVGLGKPAQGVAAWLAPGGTVRATERIGYSLGQSMFTPDDTDTSELVLDDRPYAAWLYVGVSYQATYDLWDGSAVQDVLQLELGVVGPWALGEEAQNSYHRLINVDEVNGWDNQLHNEPGINLSLERKWRSAQATAFPGTNLYVDAIPFVHGTVGNVFTLAGAGATFRLGQGLSADFGPPRIRPGAPGSDGFAPAGDFAWYLFAGGELQLVARNIFLDGNTFRDSHSVDSEPAVGDFQAGAALIFDSWRLTYTHVVRSPEFDEQDEWDQFGALSLSVRF